MVRSSKSSSSRHLAGHLLLLRAAALSLLAARLPGNTASRSFFGAPINKVTIVGGTHGNEYTGIWCIKSIEKQRDLHNRGIQSSDARVINPFREYPSLTINTLLSNPKAFMANRRFIDTDLNREFSVQKLKRSVNPCPTGDGEQVPYEAARAKEIESILGEKVDPDESACNGDEAETDAPSDIVIDLHTTTANMGITIIITEGDALMSAAAAYVLHKCKAEYGYDDVHCMLEPPTERLDRTHLPSCGGHDITIEVGPTPQGVVRHDVVERTTAALHSLLEFLHRGNAELEAPQSSDDATTISERLREIYPYGVACYRFLGKIAWPSDPENPNFPAWMVHKSVQDRDFEPLRAGDPLFLASDGTVVPYDGSYGGEVLLVFVNEGGYYYAGSGTGIGVAVKGAFDLETGRLRE
mmetsp:Transcript_14800/g.32244  ORF Transcript_14800/g.32244 Transcript_14800/m.32244 type:complete len:411 (+) Transcript_14800:188-1420(+)